jgi:hypothetical protein
MQSPEYCCSGFFVRMGIGNFNKSPISIKVQYYVSAFTEAASSKASALSSMQVC